MSPPANNNASTGSDLHALRESLSRVVQKVTGDQALRQDLMQEAMLHLWLIQTRRPGQTVSWYLQSCRFHLQHYLASGKSVDSGKRREGRLQFAFDSQTGEGVPEQADSGDSVFTDVSAREIMRLLSRHLKPQEKAVLECLADGLGAREIGRELKISHTMVIRYRRKIAALLTRLENPPPSSPGIHDHSRNGAHMQRTAGTNDHKGTNGFHQNLARSESKHS
jgi:RNA polymerase sigma factor (sigma-70 family)